MKFLPVLTILFFGMVAQGQQPPFLTEHAGQWADSVIRTMTLEERIGQLFMAYSRSDKEAKPDSLAVIIRQYHIGGIMFLKGSPMRQAELTNFFQEQAKYKMLIAIDAEWGLQMRLDSTIRFPRQMTLNAMPPDSSVYFMAAEIARQCKRMGIHINFAPVVDINNNALNPVINTRSFGEDKYEVAQKGILYMNGLQDNGVLATGKHFPGHGNTDTDSHYALPVINQSRAEMDTMELYPFIQLIRQGLGSIMVAHLFIPAYDTTQNRASTLSPLIAQRLLKDSLGFKGLVFTDALNMKGVSDYFKPGELEWLALKAGNDMLLYSDNIPEAYNRILSAVKNGELDSADVDSRVRKILMTKYWCGLNNYRPVDLKNLHADLNTDETIRMVSSFYSRSITLLQNKKELVPLSKLNKTKIASLIINDTLNNPFSFYLNRYAPVTVFRMSKDANAPALNLLTEVLSAFDVVIISIHNTNTRSGNNFGITAQMNDMITRLNARTRTIVVLFGNAYCLNFLPACDKSNVVLLAYEDTFYPQWAAAQIIFGARSTNGTLPVTTHDFEKGAGQVIRDYRWRVRFGFPEDESAPPKAFLKTDSLIANAIKDSVFPGCQLLVIKNGTVIFEKSYGYHTYEKLQPVKTTDLYDIASITKVVSTALAVMKLFEENKIDPDNKLSRYLPELKGTNKDKLTIRELMTHTAGLQAWIPFYQSALEKNTDSMVFRKHPSGDFSMTVADSLWMNHHYANEIWRQIIASPVRNRGSYVYSDLGLIILQRIIEKLTGEKLDDYVQNHFYRPLGLHRMLYNPLSHFNKSEIVPTELDMEFRKQLIHGYVHDPAAAMMNGTGGHAGIFSDAYSVGVIFQLLLNKGEYGGYRYFKPETIDLFTAKQSDNHRRALIFDRPDSNPEKNPVADSASEKTFGHQGFTGTCAWADPDSNLVFVFLSNRIHPSASNNRISRLRFRPLLMQSVYDSLMHIHP